MQDQRIRGTRWRPPSDPLVLAAVDRAQRHRQNPRSGDPTLSEIAAHLGMTWGSHASRRLRPIIDRLTGELGWLERSRRVSQERWGLTEAGAEGLARAGGEGVLEELPESPQHRAWREARAHASARIDGLQNELGEQLAAVGRLLDADEAVPASEWLAAGDELPGLIGAVAIATYCLHERPEPDDATAAPAAPHGLQSWSHPRVWVPGYGD
jgi:hypothetical protein